MFHRIWFLLLVATLPSLAFTQELRGNEVDYGGLVIWCKEGCQDESDPRMKSIWRILEYSVGQSFGNQTYWIPTGFMDKWHITPWERDYFEFEVYDWEKSDGKFVESNPRISYSIHSHSLFIELVSKLYKDLDFYFLAARKRLHDQNIEYLKSLKAAYKEGYRGIDIEDGKLNFNYYTSSWNQNNNIDTQIWYRETYIKYYNKEQASWEEKYAKAVSLVDSTSEEIDQIYREIFVKCLEKHQEEGAKFQTALESLLIGDFDEAFKQISFLIEYSERKNLNNDLLSKLYLLKGQVQSEFCLYADAILALTTSIQKNPQLKDAYFERAVAYFELGQFDRAIEDFLTSGYRSNEHFAWKTSAKISAGILSGILGGSAHSLANFVPETLSTLHGLSKGLWAFVLHPVESSNALTDAAFECIKYIRDHSPLDLLQDMVPELKSLIQNYDQLDEYEKGILIGETIGKYGVDILACKYSVKAIKAYTELKRANQLMTLEALAKPETTQKILEEAGKCWAHREAVLKNGNLKIEWGKQGKHIVGHNSYVAEKSRSIWEYPNEKTQELIEKFAGTGIKAHNSRCTLPGKAGYQEIVDFGEFIGYEINPKTGIKTSTTCGKIHYSNDGVHVVPYVKRQS